MIKDVVTYEKNIIDVNLGNSHLKKSLLRFIVRTALKMWVTLPEVVTSCQLTGGKSLTLKTGAVCFSRMLVTMCKTTPQHKPN